MDQESQPQGQGRAIARSQGLLMKFVPLAQWPKLSVFTVGAIFRIWRCSNHQCAGFIKQRMAHHNGLLPGA